MASKVVEQEGEREVLLAASGICGKGKSGASYRLNAALQRAGKKTSFPLYV